MPNRQDGSKQSSLKRRLPLVLSATTAVALAAFVALSYWQVRQALIAAGGQRAEAAATELAGVLAQSNQPRLTQLSAIASDPSVVAFLTEPTDAGRAAAERRLRALRTNGQQQITVELWRPDGNRALMLTFADDAERLVVARPFEPVAGIGPLRSAGDRVYTEATVAARRAGETAPVGYLRLRSFMARNQATSELLKRLVGGDGSIAIGSPATGVWTDLARRIDTPPVAITPGLVSYRRGDGSTRIGALVPMTGTPWSVLVDFSRASILAPSRPLLWQMLAIGGLLVFGTTLLARWSMGRITTPLMIVTDAAERLASGTLAGQVPVTRHDEVGRLAHAFNEMAVRITSGHEALARQNGVLSSVLLGMRDAVIVVDPEGNLVLVNKAAHELTGLTEASPGRWAWRAGIDMRRPDGVTPYPPAELPLTRALSGEACNDIELVIQTPVLPAPIVSNTSGSPLRDGSGAVIGAMTIHQDITGRRAHENALRSSEARKTAVLNGALDAVVRMDHTGLVTEFNPAAEATFGYSRDEDVGRELAALIIPPAYRDRHRAGLARYLATGDAPLLGKRVELTALRKDGSEFAAEVSIIAVQTDGPPMFSSFVRDLTAQKTAERARLRSVQLEEENRRVQEASRLKSEFLANMSHELRTPLNAIIGFAELLHDGVVSPDQPQHQEFLRDILTSGQHLLRLINDVLDLSKVEAGRLEFHPEELELHEAVAEVISVLRTTAASKQLQVACELDPGVRHVIIDRGRFKQVLYNYVSNALKFTPEGGRVVVRTQPDGDERFRLEVSDTGVGIAPADIARLFVEFNQLQAGAAKPQQGTGLGLALTKRLVEAQGGQVGVHSTPGEGSTFFAVLPRHVQTGTPPALPRSFPAARAGAPAVLVIEDSERDQDLLVRTLVDAGYAVETATTGAQAMGKLDTQNFDAITLDLLLPDMPGADVLSHLRAGSRNRDVPVVVITVVAENAIVSAFTVADILTKPLDGDALVATLQRLGVSAASTGSVLVVDDDPGSLRLMAASLQQMGVAATCVAEAVEALRLCEQTAPIAVVLDLQMPVMDGFEFVERFRRIPHCRRVPVVVWTVKDLTREDYERLQQSVQTIVGKGQNGGASVVAELQQFLVPEHFA
jgi:PAS domain S-box-containing protein